jgi:hypothetical protein
MYAASVENDALGSHVVTLAVEATFKMRGAGVGGTGVGGTAVGGVVGLGGAGVGAVVGAVVGGTGVAGGVHAATSMTKMVNTDSSLRYLISPSPFQSGLIRAEKVKSRLFSLSSRTSSMTWSRITEIIPLQAIVFYPRAFAKF